MTENIKETANDIKDYFVLRLKVPIFFYYLVALALWNWDIVLLIFKSKYDIEGVIWFIKNNYNGSQRIWMPFLLALASSVFFPIIMVLLDWCLKFVSKERIKSAKQVAEAEAEAQYDVQVKRNRTDKITELNNIISTKNQKIDKYFVDNQNLINEKTNLNNLLEREVARNKGLELENQRIQGQLSIFEKSEQELYLITDIENETESFYHIISTINNLNILKETLIEIFSDGYILNIFETDEILRLLEKNHFVIPDTKNNKYKFTKKGFAFSFYVFGLSSQ